MRTIVWLMCNLWIGSQHLLLPVISRNRKNGKSQSSSLAVIAFAKIEFSHFFSLVKTNFPSFLFNFVQFFFLFFVLTPSHTHRHHQRKFSRSITKAPSSMRAANKMCYMINRRSEQTSWEIFSWRKARSQVNISSRSVSLFVWLCFVIPFTRAAFALWKHHKPVFPLTWHPIYTKPPLFHNNRNFYRSRFRGWINFKAKQSRGWRKLLLTRQRI